MTTSKNLKTLVLFFALHLTVWTLIPLLRQSLPMDSLEAIIWGQFCDLGTQKHPPLSGFPAYFFFTFLGQSSISIYLLGQLCILLGFIYIFRLGKLFLPEDKAVLATMLMEGIVYYGFTSAEYNVNIVSLALFPLATFYFYKAVRTDRLGEWLLFAFFAALNLLNKYTSGVLLGGAGLYLLLTKEGRASFSSPRFYLATVFGAALLAPHFYWLYEYDFFTLGYFSGRAGTSSNLGIFAHLLYPIKFLLAQVLAGAAALVLYFAFFLKYRKVKEQKSSTSASATATANNPSRTPQNTAFILWLGLAPLLLFASVSLATGVYLKSMWGTPLLYMLTIGIFYFFPFTITTITAQNIRRWVYIIMALSALAAIPTNAYSSSEKRNFPSREFATDMQNLWHSQFNTPLAFIGGDIWYASNAALYGTGEPFVLLTLPHINNPWIEKHELLTEGALLISDQPAYYDSLKDLYPLSPLHTYSLKLQSTFGKTKKKDIYYFYILPKLEE